MFKILLSGATAAALVAGGAAYAAPQPAQKAKTAKTEARSEVQTRSQAMFARLDTNHDGFITDAEVEALRAKRTAKIEQRAKTFDPAKTFARLDTNKDGKITVAEVQAKMSARKTTTGKPADANAGVARLFARVDSNKDGKVSLAEMQAVAFQQFDRADANHDGKVTPEERKSERQMLRAQHKPS